MPVLAAELRRAGSGQSAGLQRGERSVDAGEGELSDREPAVLLAAGGNIEMFFSSTRGGAWTIWRSVLDIAALTFAAPQQVTKTAFSNRAPLAMDTGAGTLVAFRSNESLTYASAVYGATRTLDSRYGGTTTADTRNAAKLALRGKFDDFQAYTYEAGTQGVRNNNDRIGRDTIGLFLTPDTARDELAESAHRRQAERPGWPEAAPGNHGADEREPLDPRGVHQRVRDGDGAAERVAHQRRLREPEPVHEPAQRTGEVREAVARGRLGRGCLRRRNCRGRSRHAMFCLRERWRRRCRHDSCDTC
jgi:hypothetical protein